MVIFIILTFALSSIAFFVTGFTGAATQQEEFKPLDSYVVEGQLDGAAEDVYMRNGFTIVRYYYSGSPEPYIDQLPQSFQTNFGRVQLIVEKMGGSENKVEILNTNGYESLADVSRQALSAKLCELLLFTPLECSFANLTK